MAQIKEMLLFGAGLVITVALIFVGYNVFSKALGIGKIVTDREEQKLQALQLEEIEKYEGKEIQGNKIVSYVRSLYGKADVTINITVHDSSGSAYAFDINDNSIYGLRDESSRFFVNPMRKYRVTVIRDKNDSITGIQIKEQ